MPSHPYRNQALAGTCLVLLTVFLGGCREGGPAGVRERGLERTLGVAMWEPAVIDPSLASEEAGITVARALFEGLLRPAPGDGAPLPGVAASYDVSDDGLLWTFYLRRDAYWSDGRPVTSYDFEYAWHRVLDPGTGSRAAAQMFFVEGAEEEFRGGPDGGARGAVWAPDPWTLVVRLRSPAPFFPSLLTYPAYFPVRSDVVRTWGRQWTRPGRIVSNGAFTLEAFEPGVKAVLNPNPAYWDAGNVGLDRVVFYFVQNDRVAYDWFVAGKVHWLKGTLNRDVIPVMMKTRPAEFHAEPVLCTYYAAFRVDRPPFDDERARHAFNLAVDKRKLVGEVLMGGQQPAAAFVPPVIEGPTGYAPPQGPGFDPVLARELFEEYVGDKGGLPPVTYLYNVSEAHKLVGEFLQAQWKRNLGVDVAIRAVEWKTLLSIMRRGDFQVARASWCADYVDPGNFLEVFSGDSPNNYPGFRDDRYDALVRLAGARRGAGNRNRLYADAEQLLVEQAPILPLYHYTRIYLLSPRVTGFQPNLLDVHPLEFLGLR